jgi:hypothetical protein
VLDTSQIDEGLPFVFLSWFFAGSNDGGDYMYELFNHAYCQQPGEP